MHKVKKPKFVVIGGGTGSFTLLSGLKNYVSDITAIVNMADDGGSSGILRDELGVLPPGDVRQCLVALSDSSKLRELFSYRFDEGTLKGHSFGNLFLSVVEKQTDSFSEAITLASDMLQITGRVLPVTLQNTKMVLEDSEGKITVGEFKIGHMNFNNLHKPKISLKPHAKLNPDAKQSILEADVVVIAPGNLYGSLAPALVVDGMGLALKRTNAKIVYVCNLVTKPGQTDNFSVSDYVSEIERFCRNRVVDYVIFNTDQPTDAMLKKYTHQGEFAVEFDLEEMENAHYKTIGLPLIDNRPVEIKKDDSIGKYRTLIRHDTEFLARQLMRIYFE